MATRQEVDTVIVGAGPAGLAAGIVLAQRGLQTVVCDRRRLPIDKPCGEGVMPTGLAHLDQLGVKRYIDSKHARPFRGICYRGPHGETASANFAEGPGWGIRRTALSAAFSKRAQEFSHLEIHDGVLAQPFARTADGILVRVGGALFSTRLLIGADGLASQVRRWAGLDGRPRALQRYGARQHFHIQPWSSHVEVYWTNGAEAYVTPCGDDQVGVSLLWDRARFHAIEGGVHLIASLLRAFPTLQTRLAGVPASSAPRAVGPLYRTARAPISDGVLLIGDAAGYLDAITGEGISLALAQALSLDTTVAPLLQRTGGRCALLSAKDLSDYQAAYTSIVKPYYRVTHFVLAVSRYPRLASRIIRALGHRPDVFQHLLSANMGLVSPWALGVSKTAHFLHALLTTSSS